MVLVKAKCVKNEVYILVGGLIYSKYIALYLCHWEPQWWAKFFSPFYKRVKMFCGC